MSIRGLLTDRRTQGALIFCLAALTLLCIGLRIRALSRFDFYPDSYHFMLMAREFAHSGGMNGRLGPNGDLFVPSPGPLYKWGYPLTMALPVALGADPEWAGHLVATLAGILCPFAAFAFLLGLCRKKGPALAAFALTVFSYEISTWSGFVMSDIPSMVTGLFGLALLVHARRMSHWILSGLLIGWTAVGRPELSILAFPCVLFILSQRRGWGALLGFLVPFGILFLGVTLYFGLQIPRSHFVLGGSTDSLFDKVFGRFSDLPRMLKVHKSFIVFAIAEAPLVFCAGLGVLNMIRERQVGLLLLFVSLSLPFVLFYNVTGGQHRYYAQIIPGLLIPASLWLGQSDRWRHLWPGRPLLGRICVGIALVGMGGQAFEVVRRGHRPVDYRGELGRWVASLRSQGKIKEKDVVFTIDERAVHFRTELSCRGIRRTPPCVNTEGLDEASEVVFIIDDYIVGRKMPGFRDRLVNGSTLMGSMESDALLDHVYHLGEEGRRSVEAWRVPMSVAQGLATWTP